MDPTLVSILQRERDAVQRRIASQSSIYSSTLLVVQASEPGSALNKAAKLRSERQLKALESERALLQEILVKLDPLLVTSKQTDIESVAPPAPLKPAKPPRGGV